MSTFVIINQLVPSEPTERFDRAMVDVLPETVFSIKGDRIWIVFEGSSADWGEKRGMGIAFSNDFLAALYVATGQFSELFSTDWVEVEPPPHLKVVTGRLLDATRQQMLAPSDFDEVWRTLQLHRSDAVLRLMSRDLYRARQFPEEQILFFYRAVDAVRARFRGWKSLEKELGLSKGFTLPLKRLANAETGSRHPTEAFDLRSPTSSQITTCSNIAATVYRKYVAYITGSLSRRT